MSEIYLKKSDYVTYTRRLLAEKFPTREAIISEIMNLEAILHLPKATEHFVSDLHGEYPAFDHILRNGSGNVYQKIKETFGSRLTKESLQDFALLIYYPEDKLRIQAQKLIAADLEQWYLDTIIRLLELLKMVASKYTRSKVRKALDPSFVYITEELLYTDQAQEDKRNYFNQLLKNLVRMGMVKEFIKATCYTIQRLVVDHLHVIGDIYDRGEHPDLIMETLMNYHSVDIQWGNHDMLWIGAASGSELCMLNLLRICARYNNLATVEDAYGISLRHLSKFAEETYGLNPAFLPKLVKGDSFSFRGEQLQLTQLQQALAIMQFKLEGQVIARQKEFQMEDTALLDKVDYKQKTLSLAGHTYHLENTCFDTINPDNPYELTNEEAQIIAGLRQSFINSKALRRHLDFLIKKGSMYLTYNGNLLVHGCLPVDEQGNFLAFNYQGKAYYGRSLLDFFDDKVRYAYSHPEGDQTAQDLIWYLWQGPISPLFGKKQMTTFARYFIKDKASHEEVRNPYFKLRKQEEFVKKILVEFGLDTSGHVINGHTPVKRGHEAILANSRMLVIDGGYSKAYQPTTGFGGYTLLYNSYGLQLVAHHPFTSKEETLKSGQDIISTTRVVNHELKRKLVADTDIGRRLKENIALLKTMLD